MCAPRDAQQPELKNEKNGLDDAENIKKRNCMVNGNTIIKLKIKPKRRHFNKNNRL